MRRLILATAMLAALATAAHAQPSPPAPFVPIVLDEARANELMQALDQISMPAASYRQVVAIIQQLEQRAQREQKAAKPDPAPPPAQ